MSYGKSKTTNNSRPLTGEERGDIFNWGMRSINSALGNYAAPAPTAAQPGAAGKGQSQAQPTQGLEGSEKLLAPQYRTPGYVYTGAPRTMSGGDYNRLEDSIVSSRWAPLQRYESQVRDRTDEDLNRRGIWSSGVATQAQNDITEQFLPQYTAAGAEAAAQRYGMQSQEQQFLNQLTAQEADRETAYRQAEAQQQFASQWAPLEYLMGLYNQTGGAISSGKTNQFNAAVPINMSIA